MKAVSYEKAGEFLAGLSRAIVVCHVGPDVDAYGSMCAVGLALEKLGKEVLLLNESPLVQNLCFLAGTDRIVHTLPDDWEDVSAVICDCGDEKRVGDSLRSSIFNGKRETLNIDHHISNDYFASSNAVYPEASSTCEIVFEILSAMGILIDSSIAQCLFAGISGDTGSFQYSSTSARTFQVAHELVKLGADPYGVYLQMYASTPLKVFQLQTHALNQIQFHFDNRLAELLIDEATFEKFGVTDDELQNPRVGSSDRGGAYFLFRSPGRRSVESEPKSEREGTRCVNGCKSLWWWWTQSSRNFSYAK